ncbi:MAG TPA: PQQ-like beta-propeller repeat protein [Rhodothermales bacterium]|nr:PQQ-like beta-propeller repeat protein [Rhodothermales bacterium]
MRLLKQHLAPANIFQLWQILLFVLLVLQGCASVKIPDIQPQNGDWFKEDGPEAGYYTAHAFSGPLEVAWQYNTASGMGPSAVMASGGVLLAATLKGEVHAIGTERGRKIGYVPLGEGIRGIPVLADDLMLVAGTSGRYHLTAYQYTRASVKWRKKGLKSETGLLKVGNWVCFVDADGTVYAIDPTDGRETWKTTWLTQPKAIYGTPVLESGKILLASASGEIGALNAETGRVVWKKNVGEPIFAALSVQKEKVAVSTMRGRLYFLNVNNGEEIWQYNLHNEAVRFGTAALGPDGVVFGGSDGWVRKLNITNGTLAWALKTEGACTAPLFWAGAEVFAGCQDKILYRILATSGELTGRLLLKGRIKSVPILHDGRLFVSYEPNQLVAIGRPVQKSRSANPD